MTTPEPAPPDPGATQLSLSDLAGEDLAALIERGDLAPPRRLELFLRLCDGVAFAHSRGVVHHDLKPGNVMLGAFGEVLVMD